MSVLSQSTSAIEAYSYDEETATGAIDEKTPEFLQLYKVFLDWSRTMNLVRPVMFDAREALARELRCHIASTDPDLFKLVDHNNPGVYVTVMLKWNEEQQ